MIGDKGGKRLIFVFIAFSKAFFGHFDSLRANAIIENFKIMVRIIDFEGGFESRNFGTESVDHGIAKNSNGVGFGFGIRTNNRRCRLTQDLADRKIKIGDIGIQ